MTKNYFDYLEQILKDESLTKEQKAQLIKQAHIDYDKSINNEKFKTIAKKWAGGALEIGSAAIPVGGAGTVAGKVIPAILSKTLGRKFMQDVAKSAIGSIINGTIYGTGRGLVEDKNPLKTAAEGAAINTIIGGTLGAATGKIINDARAAETKGIDQMRKVWGIPYRKASGNPELAIQTLLKNKKGFVPNVYAKPGLGKFDIPWGKQGPNGYGLSHAIEQRSGQKNLDINKFLNEIPNTIREGVITPGGTKHPENMNIESLSQKLAIAPDVKLNGAERNWMVTAHPQRMSAKKRSMYLTPLSNISSENGTRSISELLADSDNIAKYLQKNNPSESLNAKFATIINAFTDKIQNQPNVNSKEFILKGGVEKNFNTNRNEVPDLPFDNNRIFTREDIGSMAADEYLQNEDAIHAQWGKIGIPTNGDMEREMITGGNVIYVQPYTRKDGTKVKGYYRSIK